MLLPDTLADRFTVIRSLGASSGSMAVLADDTERGRLVLRVWPGADKRVAPRSRKLEGLRHPAMPRVYGSGIDKEAGVTWLAHDRVRGLNLAQIRMALGDALAPDQVAMLLVPIAELLHVCHSHGLTHGRISLRQVVLELDDDDLIRARLTGLEPPEDDPYPDAGVFHPKGVFGVPADVCALAAIAFWLTTGRGPSGDLWNWDRPHAPEHRDASWAGQLGFWLAPGSGVVMEDVVETLASRRPASLDAIRDVLKVEKMARLPAQLGGTVPIAWVPPAQTPIPVDRPDFSTPQGRGKFMLGVALGATAGMIVTLSGLMGLATLVR